MICPVAVAVPPLSGRDAVMYCLQVGQTRPLRMKVRKKCDLPSRQPCKQVNLRGVDVRASQGEDELTKLFADMQLDG